MKKIIAILYWSIFIGLTPAMGQTGQEMFKLSDITNGVFYPRSAGSGFRSTKDGKYYTVLSRDRSQILRYSYENPDKVDTLFDCKNARNCHFNTIDDYRISDNGLQIILLNNSHRIYRRSISYDAYQYDVRRRMVSPLHEGKDQVRIPTLSPDGRMCAYVVNNDIYIKKFDFDTEVRVTTDGERNKILNGITDWVYEEELETISLMNWSKDSKYLAYVRTDESAVKMYDMTIYGKGLYPFVYEYKYPVAGEANSKVSVYLYNILNRDAKEVTLPLEGDFYIPRLNFYDQSLYVFTLNRRQNDLKLFSINPKSQVVRLWMEDKDDKYIDNKWIIKFRFTPNGALYVNDKDAYARLYKYDKQGNQSRKITTVDYDVTDFYGVTSKGETIVSFAAPTPFDRTIVAIDKNGHQRSLSPTNSYSQAIFSTDLSYYLLSYSTLSNVPRYEIRRTKDAKVIKVLEDNHKLKDELQKYDFQQKEFITVKTENGQTLNAWILKPPHFDPNKKYPLVMTQYSGPNSQEVLNRFNIDWVYALAQKGVVVACVDGRGTGGRGRAFRKCTYLKMGLLESEDQIAAAKALGNLPYIFPDRIGIFGWSFGGYNTLMCMTRGNGTFKVGVAVAPPSTWRLYDTIYTERYMRTPQENPTGYEDTSVMKYVNGLQGKLLIVHGTADDNVHIQNTMLLTEALIYANKQYDMMIYTDKNHSIYGGNTRNQLFTKVIDYFTSNL